MLLYGDSGHYLPGLRSSTHGHVFVSLRGLLKVKQISIPACFLLDLHGFGMVFGEFGVSALFLLSFPFAEELGGEPG